VALVLYFHIQSEENREFSSIGVFPSTSEFKLGAKEFIPQSVEKKKKLNPEVKEFVPSAKQSKQLLDEPGSKQKNSNISLQPVSNNFHARNSSLRSDSREFVSHSSEQNFKAEYHTQQPCQQTSPPAPGQKNPTRTQPNTFPSTKFQTLKNTNKFPPAVPSYQTSPSQFASTSPNQINQFNLPSTSSHGVPTPTMTLSTPINGLQQVSSLGTINSPSLNIQPLHAYSQIQPTSVHSNQRNSQFNAHFTNNIKHASLSPISTYKMSPPTATHNLPSSSSHQNLPLQKPQSHQIQQVPPGNPVRRSPPQIPRKKPERPALWTRTDEDQIDVRNMEIHETEQNFELSPRPPLQPLPRLPVQTRFKKPSTQLKSQRVERARIKTRFSQENEREKEKRSSNSRIAHQSRLGSHTSHALSSIARCTKKKKKSKKANYFIALKITNPSIKKRVKSIQNALKKQQPELEKCMVPEDSLHLTLSIMNLPNEQDMWRALEGFSSFGKYKLQEVLPSKTSCRLALDGVKNFRKRVLYGTVQDGTPRDKLKKIHNALRAHFQVCGLEGEYFRKFEPHLTIAKVGIRESIVISPENVNNMGECFRNFGFQFVHRLDFCQMREGEACEAIYRPLKSIAPNRI